MKFFTLHFFLLITVLNVYSQNGTIKGKIIGDSATISNASIKILGLNKSTTSSSEGLFEFSEIPKGNYSLLFTAVGYQTKRLKVSLTADSIFLNVKLSNQVSQLKEVVVTGVNRATELRKSPVPIAVLSKKVMDQNLNTNLIDAITKGVPGISAVTTGPNVSKPFIRGLGYNRVLTLYDGLRQEGQQWGDEHGIEVDENNIGRAEVVKGPASLTYGSDALAGVINMIPLSNAKIEGKVSGNVGTNYQSNNGLFGGTLGLAYLKNDWSFDLRASGKRAHNYYNKVDGYVYGTAFAEYNLSASAQVAKKWGFNKTAVTYYDNQMEIPDGSRDSLSRKFTRQVLDDGDDIKNRPIVPEGDLTRYKINPLHQHIQHFRLYNTSQIKLGNSDLNLLIGGQQSVRREYNHPTLPDQAGLYVVLKTINYDVKYNLPNFYGIESTIGVNGMYQTNKSKDATDFPIPDYNLFDVGGFYFAKKSFGKVDISGGIRVDRRYINWDDFYVGANPQNGFEQQVNASDTSGKLQFPAFKKNYYGVSGSLGFTYNISEQLLIKGNISRGYRAPNITEIGSNGLDPGARIVYLGNRTFKPEFNLQQDIGIIAYLPDAELSLELFNNNIENYIYQARLTDADGNPVVIVPGNSTYQYQQSKARLYGAEITANIHPQGAKWLSFNNSLAYVVGLNQNKELLRLYGNQAKYLPFIPPLQIRTGFQLTAQQPIGFLDKPYFKVDANIVSDQNKFYALDNTETFTKGYTLINVGLGSSIKRNQSDKVLMDIFFQVDNLFDVAYQAHLNRLKYFEYYSASPNGRSGIYNMGRNISIKLMVPF